MSSEPDKIIYSMIRVGKRHGQREVLKDISLSYFYGAKIGVLGLNGSGKSSLLKILAGVDQAFDGKTVLAPGYTIGYLEQEPLVDETRAVREVVAEGVAELVAIRNSFEEINARFADPMSAEEMDALIAKQAEVQEEMDNKNIWDLDARLEMAMDALRCPPGDTPVAVISGGEKRRVALCRLLLQNPDILLLDEPTNHLDAESVAWLERYLSTFPGTVIAVTHDRYFLDNVAGWILELDRGRGIPWKGNYSSWLEQKQKRLAQEEKTEAERQKTLARELDWIRMSPKGRHAKGKARINAYEAMLSHESERLAPDLEIYIPPGPRLGKLVFEAEGVGKTLGDKLLIENMNFLIPPGAIVGVIGPNGAGKTTLFRMLAGLDKPDAGALKVGESVRIAYVDQGRESLTPGKTVYELISDGAESVRLGGREMNARAYCTRFNFLGADQQKTADALSGGERNRLHLARMLKSGANVILLDEPTNDLDVNTMRALEDALENFAGCVLVISHDRWFLDRIATHILAFEGDSSALFFDGNYSEYEADRKKRFGKDADTPTRMTNARAIRAKMKSGATVGSWLQIPSPEVAELMGRAGYDWVAADMEHGLFTRTGLADVCRAIELGGGAPFARVAQATKNEIKGALEAGAQGLIFPMIESRAQLDDAISWALYPDQGGSRGVGFCRANLYGKELAVYRDGAAGDLILVAQIEHIRALEELPRILAHPRLDAIMVGPYDLSGSMGLTGRFDHPDFIAAMQGIQDACTRHGANMGVHIVEPDPAELAQRIKQGYRFIAYGIDAVFLWRNAQRPAGG